MKEHIRGNNLIIEKDIEKSKEKHKIYWKVQCILCGNIRSVRNDNLNQSCMSCAAKNRKRTGIIDDLTNKKFGYWTVIKKADKPNYWHCKCECGTEKDVFRGNLIQGSSKSCGCINSWGEMQIIYILQQNKINYKKEYTFSDLKTEKGGTPRFDFALFDDKNDLICLLEFDGRQHKFYNKNWEMSYQDFENLKNIDSLKDKYCKDNGITLVRINKESDIEKTILSIVDSNKGIDKLKKI